MTDIQNNGFDVVLICRLNYLCSIDKFTNVSHNIIEHILGKERRDYIRMLYPERKEDTCI